MSRALHSQDGKRKDGISVLEDLKRQDGLLLALLDSDKDEQKNGAEDKEAQDAGVRPGELDAADLDRKQQGQDDQGEQDGALEVDAGELALLAGRVVGVIG